MEEDTSTVEPQAGDTENLQPQAGTTTPEPQAGDGNSETMTLEKAKKINSENYGLRKRLKAYEEAEAKAKEAQRQQAEAELTETQKLQKRLTDLQNLYDQSTKQTQARIVQYEVQLQAARMGIHDPDAAAKLMDQSLLEYDEQGNPSNVEALLKDLIKAKPYLANKPAPTSGGATNPSRSHSSAPPPITLELLGSMTSKEYNERRAEITKWMADNPTLR